MSDGLILTQSGLTTECIYIDYLPKNEFSESN